MIYKFFDAPKPGERELSNGFRHLDMKEVTQKQEPEVSPPPPWGIPRSFHSVLLTRNRLGSNFFG